MNMSGYQEMFPNMETFTNVSKNPVSRVRETCTLCSFFAPFGCDKCRSEVRKYDEPEQSRHPKLYVGSGEDMPQWSVAQCAAA